MTEHRDSLIEVNHEGWSLVAIFSQDSKYLFSAGEGEIREWRVEDGSETARMAAGHVQCLAVSSNGRWLAAGSFMGYAFMWDARTHERVLCHVDDYGGIQCVDFSPDATRLLCATTHGTVILYDVATCEQVRELQHEDSVIAAKYASKGDRIATATVAGTVRVWDSIDGRLLVKVKITVTPQRNKGFVWVNDHLFAVSAEKIKQVDASTGSIVSEWPIPESNTNSSITVLNHGEFIAYATKSTILFFATETHTRFDPAQFGFTKLPEDIRTIGVSQCNRFVAIGGLDGRTTIHRSPDFTSLAHLRHTLQDFDIQIDDDVLNHLRHNQLEDAEELLTTKISKSDNPGHHLLASRSLVRARLEQWDNAIADATESIKIQASVVGYIARSVALIGKGEKRKAYRACDTALWRFHSKDNPFPLLMKAIVVFMGEEYDDAISRIDDLIDTMSWSPTCHAVQAHMLLLFANWRMEKDDHNGAIQLLERARAQGQSVSSPLSILISLISGWIFDNLEVTIGRHFCETLYTAGRIKEASDSLLSLTNAVKEDVVMRSISTWVSDFSQRCLSAPEVHDDVTPTSLLKEWAKSMLAGNSWKDIMDSAPNFTVPKLTIYEAICDHLELADRITEAIECFHQMKNELEETNIDDEQKKWVVDFTQRCVGKLEHFGDTATSAEKYDEAAAQYLAALSFSPTAPQLLLVKLSKARAGMQLWKDALDDANKVITLDPSSPLGYERQYIALRGAGRYGEAIHSFETMLSMMPQSSDPDVHGKYDATVTAIRSTIRNAIREFPQRLINTESGRLFDKAAQARSFETRPMFLDLISSASTPIDHARIDREVTDYYRYAMFSHKWEWIGEPLFEEIVQIVVYELGESRPHEKLKMFCKIARDLGLRWAWSDTCCINKGDHFELQEALVMMFKWYEGGAVTIVSLRGVRSPSKRGELTGSIWNTRVWTYQEYHASKVVRFYTEDWQPYLNLDIWNHKESPEIIAEMEEATGVSAQALMALRPGLDDIREKLRLASTRHTTRMEDEAYSLLGIFSMTLPVVYGEGDKALGRFLAQLLTNSGDASILAWTGQSGSFNSCLPSNIIAFSQLPTTHFPQGVNSIEMDKSVGRLRSSLNLVTVMKLYDRLCDLPVPMFVGQRMKLPCIILKLGRLVVSRSSPAQVFRVETSVGPAEITTEDDLSRFGSLYLAHPWIDALLDRHPVGNVGTMVLEENTGDGDSIATSEFSSPPGPSDTTPTVSQTRAGRLVSRLRPFGGRTSQIAPDVSSLQPSSVSPTERQKRALESIVRLRRPFGALLLVPGGSSAYRRVAAEGLIRARVEEITPAMLNKLIGCVRTVDVL